MGSKRGQRPHLWLYKDPVERQQYKCYVLMRVQAHHRREDFDLTFEEFKDAWRDHWHVRGRHREAYCLTRLDPDQPWHRTNVQTITRLEHFRQTHRKSQ